MLDQIAAGSGRQHWSEYLYLYGIVQDEAQKLRIKVINLRTHASASILAAYTDSESQSYRRSATMKIQCGEFAVKINPYVWTKRRKTYA